MWRILFFLPRNLISRVTGLLVHWRGPKPIVKWLITGFAAMYRINLSEAENDVSEYDSLGDFFVRYLKPGLRPIANAAAVHVADSRILQAGRIGEGGECVQAKGKKYSVKDLLVDPQWNEKYAGGFFVTYYLCPTDYHRVHSPVDGYITKVTYVPGDLWPVHDSAVATIQNLYAVNERVILEFSTNQGAVAVVFVGALNVGSIELSFDPIVRGNHGMKFFTRKYDIPFEVKKGDELGMFRMGSTVVTLFGPEYQRKYGGALKTGPIVKVNSALTI